MILTTIAVGAPALLGKDGNISNRTKKNMSTISALTLSGVGAAAITTATKGKSYAWNTAINKGIKNVLGKISNPDNFAKSNKFVKSFMEKFANSNIFKGIKKVGEKVAKSSGRQKLLAGLAVATLAGVVAMREHFAKKEGADNQKNIDGKKYAAIKNSYNQKLQAKDDAIETLKTEVSMKNDELKAWNETVAKFEKAAEKVGAADKIAAEIQKPEK